MSEALERLFYAVFEGLPRQGPGDAASTGRALAACRDLPPAPRVLDLGCGGGAQTLELARRLPGPILAVDRHAPLIARLQAAVRAAGLTDRVEARVADLTALDLPPGSFDLVWSEGALYAVGLDRALPICAALVRPGGYLVFTDAVWRATDAPDEVRALFADYPGMGTAADVRARLEAGPWEVVESFPLPDAAWWTDFYTPMEARIAALRARHAGDAEALAALDTLAREPALHRAHGHSYGYQFFVARRLPGRG